MRIALDKDAPRVRRVLLHAGACAGRAPTAGDADLLVLAAAGPDGEALPRARSRRPWTARPAFTSWTRTAT